MKNILITGHLGYIGSVLTQQLNAEGYRWTGIDLKNGDDARDEATMAAAVQWADAIIPLAGLVDPAECEANPDLATSTNLGAIQLLNRLRGDKPLLFPNTNMGYGVKTRLPVYRENAPLEPNSHYGITKKIAEAHVIGHGHFISLRLASAFGVSPAMKWHLLLNFYVKQAWCKGVIQVYEPEALRNFIHVHDVARCFVHCLKNYEAMKNNIYNVGIYIHTTKLGLANKIARHLPLVKVEKTRGADRDARNYFVATHKITERGFEPQISVNDGILEIIRHLNTVDA